MNVGRIARGVAVPLLAVSLAGAQTVTPLVREGDVVTGLGTVTLINGLAVDDAGNVLVHVLTDNPDPDGNAAMVDAAGNAVVQEGASLVDPPGAVLRTFNNEVRLAGDGTALFFLGLAGTGLPADEGLYRKTPPDLALLETAAVTAPGIPAGSTFSILLPGYPNNAGEIAFHSSIDDPGIPGTFDYQAIGILSTTTGAQTVLYKEGDTLPGQSHAISSLTWGWMGFNDSGSVLFGAQTFAAAGQNRVIYLDHTEVAQTGDPSPFGGNYSSLRRGKLSNSGDYAFHCDAVARPGITLNDSAFVQEGDPLPVIEPFVLSDVGEWLYVGDDGSVLWFGLWNTPLGERKGLFVDYTLLVEEGVTRLGGLVVETLPGLETSYSLSASGRYAIVEVTLQGGIEAAFRFDLW